MKNYSAMISVLLFVFVSINSFSQIIYVDHESTFQNKAITRSGFTPDSKNAILYNIKEQQTTTLKKKGKRWRLQSQSTVAFDTSGFETQQRFFYKGKERSYMERTYNANHQIVEYNRRYKSIPTSQYTYVYNDLGLLTHVKIAAKGQNYYTAVAEYQDSVITCQYAYGKDSTKLNYKYNYYYYPNGDKKKTEYFRKGKLKRVWSYTCDEEGKSIKPKKSKVKDTKICEIKQYNADSTYVMIRSLMNNKGQAEQHRKTYNKHDQLIKVEHLNIKGEIIVKYTYAYNKAGKRIKQTQYYTKKNADRIFWQREITCDNDSIRTSEREAFYKKNGSKIFASLRTFNKDGRLIKDIRYNKKDEIIITKQYTRNTNGDITKLESYDKNGALEYKYEYTYNHLGLKEAVSTYNKKNERVAVVQTKYQYHTKLKN